MKVRAYVKHSNKLKLDKQLKETVASLILLKARVYAPVETGYMRDHITIEYYGENGVCIVSNAPYSVYVHEALDTYYEYPTRAKFLEQAAIEVYNNLRGMFDISIEYNDGKGRVILYIDDVSKGYQLN